MVLLLNKLRYNSWAMKKITLNLNPKVSGFALLITLTIGLLFVINIAFRIPVGAIQPSDSDFQALTNLTERYGCYTLKKGYKSSQPLTKGEFVTTLSKCLDTVLEVANSPE